MNLVVTEIDLSTYAHLRAFIFPLDPKPPCDYRARLSANAFLFRGIRNRNAKGKRLYHVQREDEYRREIERERTSPTLAKYAIEIAHPPLESLASIWALYQTIGYDYKARRWMTPTIRVDATCTERPSP